jgi:hypothetical protein
MPGPREPPMYEPPKRATPPERPRRRRRARWQPFSWLSAAILLGAGCASAPSPDSAAPARPPLVRVALEALSEGDALEARQLEPLARILPSLEPPLSAEERALARAVAADLARRIAKRREWGAAIEARLADLRLAARSAAIAGERLGADDLAPFVDELILEGRPRGIDDLAAAWTDLGLPRTAAAAAAIIRGAGARFPADGLLESLLARGFRLEEGTIRAYAERAIEARYDARDVLFVIQRTGNDPALAARLPELAARILDFLAAPDRGVLEPALRRRLFRNAVLALDAAARLEVALPDALFEAHLRAAARDDALALDDVARALALFGRPAEPFVEARLDALRGARATPEAVAEVLAGAALLLEAGHPRAEEALLLAHGVFERAPSIDEAIGERPRAPRRYDPDAVRRLVEEVAPILAAGHAGRISLDLATALAREQGEPALAAKLEGMALASARR